jgi:hypothetical protein
MRTLHVLLLAACFAPNVHGQGTVFFANRLSSSIFVLSALDALAWLLRWRLPD